MEAINRRTTLALGLTTVATPLIAGATPAAAQTYGPDEGEEVGPGVRVVKLGERASVIQLMQWSSCATLLSSPGRRPRIT